ncbi:protein adenylyltransferase SelO family protein [Methylophaga sp.]|uniref:protein adenylyltransferase SelO family protein n=1 Tax=Methylophaga sp. TaxID=2024840 RepID=UPI002717AA9D|nr:YdiU family protein [Methylophaga sp.]MDO8828082.1 YdiU family protein [Methylophaga sp.]
MKTRAWYNNWQQCPDRFYRHVTPTPLDSAYFIHCNKLVAQSLGLDVDTVMSQTSLACFNGETVFPQLRPIATAYAGHQFGIYTATLGDGRTILLGQIEATDGQCNDLQVKGAGLTPYSRVMNGRYALAEAIREYLASAALKALGVPSAMGLCLIGSKTTLDENGTTAALLVRVATTHIRFGHFEYYYHRDDIDGLTRLFNFVVDQYFPELLKQTVRDRPLMFLEIVIVRTAKLIAQWQSLGFTHGVMNTDNMAISGDTLDLGPYGFITNYDPRFSPNTSDEFGRYQFDQQADIGRWNCLALAQALTPLLPKPVVPANLLRLFRQTYQQHYLALMRAKLGLQQNEHHDAELISALLAIISQTRCDYSNFFIDLSQFSAAPNDDNQSLFETGQHRALLENWLQHYRARLGRESQSELHRQAMMKAVNPQVILREDMLSSVIKAANNGDFSELINVMHQLQNPFRYHQADLEQQPGQAVAMGSAVFQKSNEVMM